MSYHAKGSHGQTYKEYGRYQKNSQYQVKDKRIGHQQQFDQENSGKLEMQKVQKQPVQQVEFQVQEQSHNKLNLNKHLNQDTVNEMDYSNYVKQELPQFPIQLFPMFTPHVTIPTMPQNYIYPYQFQPQFQPYNQTPTSTLQHFANDINSHSDDSLNSSYISCGNAIAPLISQFSTPKMQGNCNHPITINCLRKCATWNLAIKYNTQKASKVQQSAIACRTNGTIQSGPTQFTQDILDALVQKELTNQCSQVPILMNQSLHLKEFNSFMQSENTTSNYSSQTHLVLPLDNSESSTYTSCTDILKSYMSEHMFCIEFDLNELPLIQPYQSESSESATPTSSNEASQQEGNVNNNGTRQSNLAKQNDVNPRIINQALVESTIHFYINGSCHGQRILTQDLHFQLQGKKIVKSIQARILDYKEYIQKQVQNKIQQLSHQQCKCKCQQQHYQQHLYKNQSNNYKCVHQQHLPPMVNNFKYNMNVLNQLNGQNTGPYLTRTNTLHTKMLNINKSIGIEFTFDNLPKIESFLTNFNQLVLQEGIINKVLFCFNLPLSKMMGSALSQPLVADPNRMVTPVKQLIFKDQTNTQQSSSEEKKSNQKNESAKPFNLLEEFHKIKVTNNQQEQGLLASQRSNSSSSDSTQSSMEPPHYHTQMLNQPMYQMPIQNNNPSQPSNVFAYQQPQQMMYQQPSTYQMMYLQHEQQMQHYLFNPLSLMQTNYSVPQSHNFGMKDLDPNQQVESNDDVHYQRQRPRQLPFLNNLDLFLDQTSPSIQQEDMSLKCFFDQYLESSINGAKIVLYNQDLDCPEILICIPTLSALYLKYYEMNEQGDPLTQKRRYRVFDYEEEVPNYLRDPLSITIESLYSQNPVIPSLSLMNDVDTRESWFSIVWTPIKYLQLNKEKMNNCSTTLTQQFLVIYGFQQRFGKNVDGKVKVIGFLPLNDNDQEYWIHAIANMNDTDNNNLHSDYQVQMNQRREYQRNRDKLIDLKDRAIQFLEIESSKGYDYSYFIDSMNLFFDQS